MREGSYFTDSENEDCQGKGGVQGEGQRPPSDFPRTCECGM